MAAVIDMVGERIGMLVVVSRCTSGPEYEHLRKYCRTAIWNCLCDCGKEKAIAREELTRMQVGNRGNRRPIKVKSCGCVSGPKDESGKRFGRLLVIKQLTEGPDYDRIKGYKSATVWLCKCDCGQMTVKAGTDLRRKPEHHPAVSCGCLQEDSASINRSRLDTQPIVNLDDQFVRERMAKRGFKCKPLVIFDGDQRTSR